MALKILSLREWTLVVGIPFIFLLLPVQTSNPYKHSQQTSWDPTMDQYTINWVNNFALVQPFQLWPNVTARYFLELENMTHYDCPRVYYPTCAKNRVTYVNPCIMHALNEKFMRFGACLLFRRSENDNESAVIIPQKWKTSQTEYEELRKNYKFTKQDFIKMLNDSLIPFDLIKESHPELFREPPRGLN